MEKEGTFRGGISLNEFQKFFPMKAAKRARDSGTPPCVGAKRRIVLDSTGGEDGDRVEEVIYSHC